MSSNLTFIIGGARSGKTSFALKKAEGFQGRKIYMATAEALDPEMEERIKRHKAERTGWETLEEPRELASRIVSVKDASVIIIDCLTLWVTNLIASGDDDGDIIMKAGALAEECGRGAPVIAVSNEVGLGIVPDNALARRFRDLAGKVNQITAANASEVYMVAAGIPLKMK